MGISTWLRKFLRTDGSQHPQGFDRFQRKLSTPRRGGSKPRISAKRKHHMAERRSRKRMTSLARLHSGMTR